MGWDKLTTFVTEYQDALSALSTGQMSGLVKTTYGYHIILCTDQFNVESVSSADEIPEAIRDAISSKIKAEEESAKYSTWLNDYIDKADIKILEMSEKAGNNSERTENLREQVAVLESLLPAQVSGDELAALIDQVIAEIGAESKKDMGRVMGALTKATNGNFDKPAAAQMVGARLA